MGNKMCKKKGGESVVADEKPNPFEKFINRLHLKPTTWKSDPELNEKKSNRSEVKNRKSKNGIIQHPRPLSNARSSDWTDATLEVPEKDEVIHLKNPQMSLIFNNDSTPTPPPRKHKKTLREKLETVAKNGLQAFQPKKVVPMSKEAPPENPKPVEEPPCIKKIVIYGCPLDDHDHTHHNRDHKHVSKKDERSISSKLKKDEKRKQNLSVVSLPNINEIRLSAKKEDLKKTESGSDIVDGEQKPKTSSSSTGKLEFYMHRCKSIGSIFPQKIKHKELKTTNDAESDDSFGGLEDWDCKILEHYKPKDASLQRPRRPLSDKGVLSDIEKLIVTQEEFEKDNPPVRPVRRSESLVKKEQNVVVERGVEAIEEPEVKKKKDEEHLNEIRKHLLEDTGKIVEEIINDSKEDILKRTVVERRRDKSRETSPVKKLIIGDSRQEHKRHESTKTPPTTPVVYDDKRESIISISKLTTKDEEGNVEHSSLIKLLHEYNKNEKAKEKIAKIDENIPGNEICANDEENKCNKQITVKQQTKLTSDKSDGPISQAVTNFLNAERVNTGLSIGPSAQIVT